MKSNVLKSIKNIYLIVKVIYVFPAVFTHELFHAISSFIMGFQFNKIEIKISKDKGLDATCHGYSFFDKRDIIRSLSPFIIPVITIGLMFINLPVFFLIFIYEISVYKFILPSPQDIEYAKKSLNNPYWRICN